MGKEFRLGVPEKLAPELRSEGSVGVCPKRGQGQRLGWGKHSVQRDEHAPRHRERTGCRRGA